MGGTRDRIPAHLRRFVAVHDYRGYDELDQSVWRFILSQVRQALRDAAHPAYAAGLVQTGITLERIPRIEEIDARLSEFGWGAVCVDGFITPRAFQEFQANRILPIAGEIRSHEHLAYTPAPDIVHEAAGHAPIVPDPAYREYLQRIGEVGARAFTLPSDLRLYDAIHLLSLVKEDPSATAQELARAERQFEEARAAARKVSEAALVARLHWWTVEYGLVGTVDDYRIYGAGLLSSLGESESCRSSEVRKLELDASCIDVGYDITRQQPQLFVTESFERLGEVLERVASRLAQRSGGGAALDAALASREVATVELDSGIAVTGVVERVRGDLDEPAWIELDGPASLALRGAHLDGHGPRAHRRGLAFPIGVLEDGTSLAHLDAGQLAARRHPRSRRDEIELRFRSGVRVRGRLVDVVRGEAGKSLAITLLGGSARRGGVSLPVPRGKPWTIPLGERVTAAFAGPADPAFWPATQFPSRRVPARRLRPAAQRRLLALHREAAALAADADREGALPGFARVAKALEGSFADEWLLRWNLLGWVREAGPPGAQLAADLARELQAIDEHGVGAAAERPPIRRALGTIENAPEPAPSVAASRKLELVSSAGVRGPRPGAIPNPMGTDGFEFIEYATTDPPGLDRLFRSMGMAAVARHRSKDVTLYRQGDVHFILDAEPSSFAQAFAQVHGPSICAIAFRVKDARAAFERAVALGATPVRGRVGPMELNLPAIRGIGGSLIYLIDRYGDRTIYDVDFVQTGDAPPAEVGLTSVDHLTHNVHKGRMNKWAEFYERLFGFREIRYFDIRGQQTGLLSRALVSPCGKIRIPINEPTERGSQIQEYLAAYHGEGIQHVALATGDIFATVEAMRARGLKFLATPGTYFDAIDQRLPGHGLDVEELRRLAILVDGTTSGAKRLLLQIFTETVIGPIFFEIIERRGDDGFGEGNFRALFEAMERDQIQRGVL